MGTLRPDAGSRQSDVVAVAAGDARRARRGAHGGRRRRAVPRRRPALSRSSRSSRARWRSSTRPATRSSATAPSGFLGEMNLLSGQTVFLTAVVTQPLRYIAVDRDALRPLLFDDGPLSDLLLSTFIARREALQQVAGHRPRDRRPALVRGDDADGRVRPQQPPAVHLARPRARRRSDAAALVAGLDAASLPLVRLPGGAELRGPSTGEVSRALGIGRELAPREEVDLLVVGGGPAGLGAAVYGASEGLETLVVESTALGGQAGSSRRIENYLGFPAGISGTELTSRAVTQARKFDARTATPYRALVARAGRRTPRRAPRGGPRDRGARRPARDRRAVPAAPGRRALATTRGISVFYAAGPPEAQLCGASRVGVVGGGNSAGQAAVWLARGGALVTLLHRRADLRETMSDYLVARARALRRRGARPQRDRRAARRATASSRRSRCKTASACRSRSCSSSSARCRAPTGSATRSRATRTASSSPAPPPAPTACSRRACPASSRPATSARARPSAAPPPSAKERWPCSSSTLASHVKRATARPANSHRVDEVAASASQALSRVTGTGGFHIPCYPDSRRAGAQKGQGTRRMRRRGAGVPMRCAGRAVRRHRQAGE